MAAAVVVAVRSGPGRGRRYSLGLVDGVRVLDPSRQFGLLSDESVAEVRVLEDGADEASHAGVERQEALLERHVLHELVHRQQLQQGFVAAEIGGGAMACLDLDLQGLALLAPAALGGLRLPLRLLQIAHLPRLLVHGPLLQQQLGAQLVELQVVHRCHSSNLLCGALGSEGFRVAHEPLSFFCPRALTRHFSQALLLRSLGLARLDLSSRLHARLLHRFQQRRLVRLLRTLRQRRQRLQLLVTRLQLSHQLLVACTHNSTTSATSPG